MTLVAGTGDAAIVWKESEVTLETPAGDERQFPVSLDPLARLQGYSRDRRELRAARFTVAAPGIWRVTVARRGTVGDKRANRFFDHTVPVGDLGDGLIRGAQRVADQANPDGTVSIVMEIRLEQLCDLAP